MMAICSSLFRKLLRGDDCMWWQWWNSANYCLCLDRRGNLKSWHNEILFFTTQKSYQLWSELASYEHTLLVSFKMWVLLIFLLQCGLMGKQGWMWERTIAHFTAVPGRNQDFPFKPSLWSSGKEKPKTGTFCLWATRIGMKRGTSISLTTATWLVWRRQIAQLGCHSNTTNAISSSETANQTCFTESTVALSILKSLERAL